jgi:hypothetical protein
MLLVATSSVACAQDDTAADRADSRLARIERARPEPKAAIGALEAGRPPPPFTFTLAIPVTYNTNIDNSDGDHRHDFHTDPSGELDYDQQSGTVRFFARAIADADEYAKHEDAGASTIVGRVGVKLVDAKLGNFSPYAHYTATLLFGRHFEDHQLTLHTFALGIKGKVPLGDVVLKPDFQIARREATNNLAERNQIGGGVTFEGDFIPDRLSWSLGQTLQFRHYTGGTNKGRDDVNFITSAALAYAISDLISVEVDFNFERNSSDRTGKDYSVFDFGPSIVLSVPFG